ncbi:hypothetical protein V1525DRAFT_391473 [Lipomyces kononenkoae]|uniref:Uncharacterized protein n=1 Tax=Lipomyces kononenkoae TaxID=34357 RepID=A0ACC3SS06_LIPKO
MALWIARTPKRKQQWKILCQANNLKAKLIEYDVDTRWNSTYRMIRDALEAKQQIRNWTEHNKSYFPPFTTHDWNRLQQIATVLAKFVVHTEKDFAEVTAASLAFKRNNPAYKHHLCLWHSLRAIDQHITGKTKSNGAHSVENARNSIRKGALPEYLHFLSNESEWILSNESGKKLCTREQAAKLRAMVKRHLLRHQLLPKVVNECVEHPRALVYETYEEIRAGSIREMLDYCRSIDRPAEGLPMLLDQLLIASGAVVSSGIDLNDSVEDDAGSLTYAEELESLQLLPTEHPEAAEENDEEAMEPLRVFACAIQQCESNPRMQRALNGFITNKETLMAQYKRHYDETLGISRSVVSLPYQVGGSFSSELSSEFHPWWRYPALQVVVDWLILELGWWRPGQSPLPFPDVVSGLAVFPFHEVMSSGLVSAESEMSE